MDNKKHDDELNEILAAVFNLYKADYDIKEKLPFILRDIRILYNRLWTKLQDEKDIQLLRIVFRGAILFVESSIEDIQRKKKN